jgi:heme-degrading monooxygenase HmoA
MIARLWRGLTQAAHADEYLDYLRATGLKDYAATDGNRGVWVLRRDLDDKTEFLLISLWESLEAIKRFAGSDYEKAVYYPEDTRFLLQLEQSVIHYKVAKQLQPLKTQ